jgi:hypothetical protein
MVMFVRRAANPFMPGGGFVGAGGGFRIPRVAFAAKVENFFDREKVIKAIDKMNYRALMKGSARVKDHARKSIRKMGLARPKLKVMKKFPNVPLAVLANPRKRKNFEYFNYEVTERDRRAVMERARQIRDRPASQPGTPPHTHVPWGHMLGFRRNLWNYFDPSTKSAVAGPSHKGRRLPYLHEFGGTVRRNYWMFQQEIPNRRGMMVAPIFWSLPEGTEPRNRNRWERTPQFDVAKYPARPFMAPAMRKAIARGDIKYAFMGQFRG